MDRLRSSSDIRHVMTTGTRAGTSALSVHVSRPRKPLHVRNASHHRIAVVAGRRVGNAVTRNRAKRRLRALIPQAIQPLPAQDLDLVIVAKNALEHLSPTQLQADMGDAYRRAWKRLANREDQSREVLGE